VNAAQGDGMTALHWAAQRGDLNDGEGAHQGARKREGHDTYRPRSRRSDRRERWQSVRRSRAVTAGSDVNA